MTQLVGVLCSAVVLALANASSAHPQSRVVLTGMVMDSATALPIPGVEISLPEIRRSTSTDSVGAFKLSALPGGALRVLFRKLGYRAIEVSFRVADGDSIDRRFVLGKGSTVLDSVKVVAAGSSGISSFDENRKIGLGHFLTREELATQGQRRIAEVLESVSGVGIMRGSTGHAYVISKRMTPSLCPRDPPTLAKKCLEGQGVYYPDRYEVRAGIQAACYAQVYLNDVLVNSSRPTEPFDISTIEADQLEAVEYYSGASQLPLKYAKLDSRCGVLVLWTRRAP